MSKITNNTSEEVRASVASIYSELLSKRKQEREVREEQKRIEEELREKEKEEKKYNDDGVKKSKKERREAEFDNWKEIIVGLTGDDLEYSNPKKNKKKYKKWIDDEQDTPILTAKPKKTKKKNYNKEFAPEIQMLKTIVADQNKFTADLQKRFNLMAGPATKDAMPPNKTMVELASAINAGRSNSLGVLREIGTLKKVVAELYLKQRKEDRDDGKGSASLGDMDLALMGSNIASSMFSDDIMTPIAGGTVPTAPATSYAVDNNTANTPMVIAGTTEVVNNVQNTTPLPQIIPGVSQIQEFDPSTWDPDGINVNPSVKYESIPHHVVVEMNKSTNNVRFKAVHNETGEELVGCPVPTYDTRNLKLNEKDLIAKGQFDETYKLEVI